MKKALNAWTVDGTTGFEEMFRQLKDSGFDGVELNVDEVGNSAHSLTLETTDSELDSIKNLSEKHGLPIVSISTSMLGGFRMGAPEEAERELAKQIIRAQLKYAKALGATGILIVPGGVPQQESFIKAYDLSMKTLMELKPDIEAAKIYTGLENVWNGFFMSPFDMANFIDRTDCPYVSAYYDVGNVIAFSWSEYWIEVLDKRISHVHVKDFKRGSSSFGGLNSGGTFVDLLEGDVNWPAIVPALKKAGFDGYLTAEVFKADENQSFTDYYKEISKAMDKIISGR
jgi:hexulose-6-phosphate isomerase